MAANSTRRSGRRDVVFIPKYRRKVLYGELRQHLGDVFRKLALQKERSYGAGGGGDGTFIVHTN
jgi:REP element-mobilizing transposase RayT